MNGTECMRAIATAIKNGSAMPAEEQELAQCVLDEPERRPLTDAELVALGALAVAEETAMARSNAVRVALGQSPAYGEDSWSDATVRLGAELRDRGAL